MAVEEKKQRVRVSILRRILTISFAFLVLAGVTWAFVDNIPLATDEHRVLAFGVYGAFLAFHLIIQSFFAFLEHRKMRKGGQVCSYSGTVALTISAFQEDPGYLRECLESVKNTHYPPDKLKIIMVIDGNQEADQYMMDMFNEVFADEDVGIYIWKYNYHSWDMDQEAQSFIAEENPEGAQGNVRTMQNISNERLHQAISENQTEEAQGDFQEADLPVYTDIVCVDLGRLKVEELIKTKRCVCIMQKWGGKREVMYTAFKALENTVDYVQVCDSDTKLYPLATQELVKVLESNDRYGAVGGDVQIWNLSDSYISFMSGLSYWTAFNLERACQSYFDCVACISGPLGLYRNDLLQSFLESWYNQKFLGTHCTFGDDRHLTNRMLSIGYATKYTARSKCYSETPAQFLRWLNQQTRWTKSYFREWLFNALWWHKQHPWMTYESIIISIFPIFVTITVIKLFFNCHLWNIVWVLLTIQLIATIKALFACLLRGNIVMIFFFLYGILFIVGLLPTKYFAFFTMNKTSWGTSGRKKIVGNYIPLLPLSIWWGILIAGFIYTLVMMLTNAGCALLEIEKTYLIIGSSVYVGYWLFMICLYWVWIKGLCRKGAVYHNVQC